MSNTTPDPTDSCEVSEPEYNPYPDARTEAADLRGRIGRLVVMLTHARRAYADLVAACRATLGAHADGEDDPLSYIRDELPAPPPEHPLSRDRSRFGGGR